MIRRNCAVVFVIFALVQLRAATQGNPRLIEVVRGTPIAEKLRSDDKSVVVQRGDIISSFVDDRVLGLEQDIDERVEFSDAIAVVEPRGTNSYLIENGEWIQSMLELHLIKSMKGNGPPVFDQNGNTTIVHDGGELQIKGVRVRAGLHYFLKRGERYLVFLKARATRSNTRVFFIGVQLRITSDDHIAPIHLSDGTEATVPSALYGMSLKQIEEEVRSRLKR